MPIRVVLDTNIYRGDRSRQGQAFKKLASLCKKGEIELVLPYIVKREFETQLRSDTQDVLLKLKKAGDDLLERQIPQDLPAQLEAVLEQLDARKEEVTTSPIAAFSAWTSEHLVIEKAFEGDQALAAMEAYFNGTAPLKVAKDRKEIPDSMLYQSIAQLAVTDPLVVVCHDGNLAEVCKALANVTVHADLGKFIGSDEVQALIIQKEIPKKAPAAAVEGLNVAEVDLADGEGDAGAVEKANQLVKATLLAMKQLTLIEPNVIGTYVSEHAGEDIASTNFSSPSLLSDDKEAYIYMYGSLDSVDFDWDQAAYYGEMTYVIPFSGSGPFNINYYVSKWDVEEIEHRRASYRPHNDYMVEADEEADLTLHGTVRVVVDPDFELGDDVGDAIIEMSIDSIDKVALTEDVDN